MIKLRMLFLVLVCFVGVYIYAPERNKNKLQAQLRYFAKALVAALILYWIFIVLPPLLKR